MRATRETRIVIPNEGLAIFATLTGHILWQDETSMYNRLYVVNASLLVLSLQCLEVSCGGLECSLALFCKQKSKESLANWLNSLSRFNC